MGLSFGLLVYRVMLQWGTCQALQFSDKCFCTTALQKTDSLEFQQENSSTTLSVTPQVEIFYFCSFLTLPVCWLECYKGACQLAV